MIGGNAEQRAYSTFPPQAGSSRAMSTDAQVASASPEAHSTNSQGAITTLPQVSQANRHSNNVNNPWGSPKDNSLENPNPKWVINLSSKPLTQAQRLNSSPGSGGGSGNHIQTTGIQAMLANY